MGQRLSWKQKPRHVQRDRKSSNLERQADRLLQREAAPTEHVRTPTSHRGYERRDTDPLPETKAYRCIGSVLNRDGLWHALDGAGKIAGTFKTRMEAWMLADKFGMEQIVNEEIA